MAWCCIGIWTAGAGAGAPNISANGFPNCKRSSEAFDGACAAAAVLSAPNRSTILAFAADAGGEDKNGFVAAFAAELVGDETFC